MTAKTTKTVAPTEKRPGKGRTTIAHILEKHKAYSAWLRSRKDANPEVFIALIEDIPSSDRDKLTKLSPLVITAQDELIKRIAQIGKENSHLKSLLMTDDLTGLYNKRFFYIQLEAEMARTRRTGHPCTLAMMDLDNFKMVNDRLGHDEGDRFLVQMGGMIKDNLRPTDFACRFGGDEFSFVMPASNLIDSIVVAKRIQISIAKLTAMLPVDVGKHISTSFGLATYEPLSRLSADAFFMQADRELYNAKKSGKDRISCGPVRPTELTSISEDEKNALSQFKSNYR